MRRIVGLAGSAMLAAGAALAQDPAVVDPAHVKVEFQNEQIRVLRVHYGPHEKSPLHTHPARVIVRMTDMHYRVISADGTASEPKAPAGGALWSEPLTQAHKVENLSDAPGETIEIEFIGEPGAALPAPSPDPAKVDPKHCKVEFENDLVRVLRWTMPPHEKAPLHEHGAGVFVLLTDVWTKGVEEDGKPTEGQRQRTDRSGRRELEPQTIPTERFCRIACGSRGACVPRRRKRAAGRDRQPGANGPGRQASGRC